jgi:hypothetical protein
MRPALGDTVKGHRLNLGADEASTAQLLPSIGNVSLANGFF